MISMDPSFIMARINKIEKQNRFWKIWSSILASILFGMVLLSLALHILFRPKVVVADAFVLGSKKGKPYATFGLAKDGSPSLAFYDEFDKRRVLLGLMPKAENSPCLLFTESDGKMRLSMSLLADGSPGILMRGADGKIRGSMLIESDGSAKLECKDNQGNTTWKAP